MFVIFKSTMNNQLRYYTNIKKTLHVLDRNKQPHVMLNEKTVEKVHKHDDNNGRFLDWQFNNGLRSRYSKDLAVTSGTVQFDNGQLIMSNGCVLKYNLNKYFPKKNFMLLIKYTDNGAQGSIEINLGNSLIFRFGYNQLESKYMITCSIVYEDDSNQDFNAINNFDTNTNYNGHNQENEIAIVLDNDVNNDVSIFLNGEKISGQAFTDFTKNIKIDTTKSFSITHTNTSEGLFKLNELVIYDVIPDNEGGLDYIQTINILQHILSDTALVSYDVSLYQGGVLEDISGNGHNIDVPNSAIPPSYVSPNPYFTFASGVMDNLYVPSLNNAESTDYKHTIACWFRAIDYVHVAFSIGQADETNSYLYHVSGLDIRHDWGLNRSTMVWTHFFNDIGFFNQNVFDIAQNTWYHLVYVYHGSKKSTLYLYGNDNNGTHLVRRAILDQPVHIHANSPVYIGRAVWTTGNEFTGDIGHFTVWDYDLKQSQVIQLFNERASVYGYTPIVDTIAWPLEHMNLMDTTNTYQFNSHFDNGSINNIQTLNNYVELTGGASVRADLGNFFTRYSFSIMWEYKTSQASGDMMYLSTYSNLLEGEDRPGFIIHMYGDSPTVRSISLKTKKGLDWGNNFMVFSRLINDIDPSVFQKYAFVFEHGFDNIVGVKSQIRLYVNGVLRHTLELSTNYTNQQLVDGIAWLPTTQSLYLNREHSAKVGSYCAYNNVQVWNRALTNDEMIAAMSQ